MTSTDVERVERTSARPFRLVRHSGTLAQGIVQFYPPALRAETKSQPWPNNTDPITARQA